VYGLLVGDIVGFVFSFMLLRSIFPMPIPFHAIARVGLCTALMAAVCAPLAFALTGHPVLSLVIVPIAGILVYGAAVYVLDVAKLRTQMPDLKMFQIGNRML